MKYTLLLTSILLFCLTGCSSKKNIKRNLDISEMRQSIQTDSMLFHCLKQSDLKQNVRLKLLTFTPPDSNKQQHLQSVLLLTSEAEETITENKTLNQVFVGTETAETHLQQQESVDKSTKSGFPVFQFIVCLVVIFLSGWGIWRRSCRR